MLNLLDFALGPSKEIVISGDEKSADTKKMIDSIYKRFVPNKVVAFRPSGDTEPIIALIPFIKEQVSLEGRATAYVCKNYVYQLPTTNIEKMNKLLEE